MKIFTVKFATVFLTLALIFGVVNTSFADSQYFPLTVESAEKAWKHAIVKYWGVEFPAWEHKINVILTTNDFSINNAAYRDAEYGVTSSENNVYVMSPAWSNTVTFGEGESPWTIPYILYDGPYCIYWVMNTDFLTSFCGGDDDILMGMINHELSHFWSYYNNYTQHTCVLGQTPLQYRGQEKLLDIYIYCTKGQLGAIIPQYKFARRSVLPFLIIGMEINPVIPYVHPVIDSLRFFGTIDPDDYRKIFFQDIEYTLRRYPGVPPVDILGDELATAYEYLLNH